jgi:hypothetical protein
MLSKVVHIVDSILAALFAATGGDQSDAAWAWGL